MDNYNTILNLISIVLLFIILFIIIFGCKGRRMFFNEKFTDKNEDTSEPTEKKDTTSEPVLTQFENNVLKKLSTGELSTEEFADLIKKEKFTTENLNNVITYVEHFKGVVN
jgi:hypothetical protein